MDLCSDTLFLSAPGRSDEEEVEAEPRTRARAPAAAVLDELDEAPQYPAPPERSWRLQDLFAAAGLELVSSSAGGGRQGVPGSAARAACPDLTVRGLLTCNSPRGLTQSLYICTPATDDELDGHDFADEAADVGAVAVLAEHGRKMPACSIPVLRCRDLQQAVGRLAATFYGGCGHVLCVCVCVLCGGRGLMRQGMNAVPREVRVVLMVWSERRNGRGNACSRMQRSLVMMHGEWQSLERR